ncbi:hypothetical protein EG832_20885, partial [bacterium]|nr:hypothetical protein [bacterium]
MEKKKVIHIHTDLKFISDARRFEGEQFDNHHIVIADSGNWSTLQESYGSEISLFEYSRKSLGRVIQLCKEYDLVIFYDLDNIKCKLALELPGSIKKAWRFFGYEIYSREPDLYYSQLTKESVRTGLVQWFKTLINKKSTALKSLIMWGYTPSSLFSEAIKRIDYFLSFSLEEYEYLKKRWANLPTFVRLSVDESYLTEKQANQIRNGSVIIGNNKSRYNNNLDVIRLIETTGNPFRYQFYLLSNYGTESDYSRKVAETIKDKEDYTIINDFMEADKFNDIYKCVSAAIFNGYRQMALGNVFTALKYGVKLYLNNHNTVMHWLLDNHIKISSVNDMSADLRGGNL